MKLETINPNKPTVLEPKPGPKTVQLTKTAIGLYKIPQKGSEGTKYVLVEIMYDPETGRAGEVKEVLRDNREDAIDKFKMKAADFFLED
jgi:hypothetical protein